MTPSLPLSGLRVISFEQFGAAPYATMFMADFGADVLKVELPEGDFARRTPPLTLGDMDSLYFQSMNLNKKSVVLDLRHDRERFHELLSGADAVVNNLRGSAPSKLGLDYEHLKEFNPAIVCGHISAYGRDNSRRERPGYDFLMQAEAGLMSMTGSPAGPPERMGVSIIDYMTGMMLAYGVVAALLAAKKTGVGTDIDASLFDTALHQLGYQGAWYLNEGMKTGRLERSAHPSNTPVQLYKTQDGWIYVAAMTDKFWLLLLERIDRDDLKSDDRFSSAEARLFNRSELTRVLDSIFETRCTSEWISKLGNYVPAAPVLDMDQALDNDFVRETQMINTIPHKDRGTIRVLSNPIKVGGARLPQRAGPVLGEH